MEIEGMKRERNRNTRDEKKEEYKWKGWKGEG